MRYIVGMAKKSKKDKPTNLGERLELRLSQAEKAAFMAAARRQSISLSLWLRLAAWQIIDEHGGAAKLRTLDQ